MRYTQIDTLGNNVSTRIYNHDITHEYLSKWRKNKPVIGKRIIRPIVYNDGVRKYKFSEASWTFFIPETHPMYNCSVIATAFMEAYFPIDSNSTSMIIPFRNAIFDELNERRT